MDYCPTLLELTTQKLECVGDRLTNVNSSGLLLGGTGNSPKSRNQVVDTIDLTHDYLREVLAEVDIREPLW